ncbi:MAG: MFS transporter [Elusimicrobia bacterium]|nr:MFS transporter [Elusimicrobiota bacterium]
MRALRELRQSPRELRALFWAHLINRMGTMALPFLALYLTQRRGFTVSQAGTVLGAYGAGALAAGPLSGWLCDRWGAAPLMTASLCASGAVVLLYPLAASPFAVLLLTPAWALAAHLFGPAGLSVTSELAPPARRKTAFSLNRLAINLGMSVGPVVGGLLAQWSFAALFAVDGLTSLLAGAFLWRALRGRARAGAAPGPAHSIAASLRGAAGDPRLRYFLLALIPAAMVFFQHESTLPLFLVRDLGFSTRAYGLLFVVNTALIIFIEMPLNLKTAHWPHGRALALGAALFAAGFGALAFVRGPWAVAATVAVWTFGEMILLPSASNYVADIAPAARRGSYMGLYSAAFSLALLLGPLLGAHLLDAFGAAALWASCLAGALLSAALFLRVS